MATKTDREDRFTWKDPSEIFIVDAAYAKTHPVQNVQGVKCTWCGRSGLFLTVSQFGLCKQCELTVIPNVQQRVRIINDSVKLVNESSNIDTVVSRFDTITKHAQDLYEYELKGIATTDPAPSKILEDRIIDRDKEIYHAFERSFNKLLQVVFDLKTEKAKLNRIKSFTELVLKYKPQMHDTKLLDSIEAKVNKLLEQVKNTKRDVYKELP